MTAGKVPLAYGKPNELKVFGTIYLRLLASTFSCGYAGMKNLFLRLIALPLAMCTLWLFYTNLKDDQKGFFSKSGMVLNVLGLAYGSGILTTITTFPTWRKRFVQEHSEGLYSGASLLIAYDAVSLPFSFISAAIASCVIYPIILNPSRPIGSSFLYLVIALWTSFVLAEQLCIFFNLFVKSRINTSVAVSYLLCISLSLASGTVRSYKGLLPWLQDNSRGTHTRYASLLLHNTFFLSRPVSCTAGPQTVCVAPYDFLHERLGKADPQESVDLALSIAFPIGLAIINMILYMMPMPRFVRRKFRD